MCRAICVLALCLSCWLPATAGPSPLSVVVVVNEDSPASKWVANEYIRIRSLPADRVVHLKLGDLDSETVDIETFRNRMLEPLQKAIRNRGLEKEIDTIAWSVDLPHAVRVEADMKGAKLPGIVTPVAAVNGLTYLHERVLEKKPNYLGLSANGYARRPQPVPPKSAIKAESVKKFQEAAQLLEKKEHAKAADILSELLKENGDHPILHYNLACALAQLGKEEQALDALEKAVREGWNDRTHAQRDPDFAAIRKADRFRDILNKIRVSAPSGVPFHVDEAWNEAGKKGEGNRYLLSTMLGVTTGRGNSIDEVLAGLRRSIEADGSRPKGTVYYMINGDIRSRTRQWGFAAAVDALKQLGVEAEAIEGVLPKDRKDVAGLMAGSADFDWAGSKSVILPGAICEHLTSFGGVMNWGAGQTPISEFMRYGAAGSSGTVTEPYAIQNKFPTPFIHCYYAQGFSLAEAFYLSVQGPYQLLILGDPLCRPWSPGARLIVDGLPAGKFERPASLRPRIEGGEALRFELWVDGHRQETLEQAGAFMLDPQKLGEGRHDLRVLATLKHVAEIPLHWQGSVRVGAGPLLTIEGSTPYSLGDTLHLSASFPSAETIDLVSQGRILASGKASGAFAIAASTFGPGQSEVQAVAHIGKKNIASHPILLEIAPPRFEAVAAPKNLKPGMRWTDAAGNAWRLPKLSDGKRFADPKVKEALKLGGDQQFVLEGWLEAKEVATWQMDSRQGNRWKVSLDGKSLLLGRHVMTLMPGWHHLKVEGKGEPTSIDVRFGSRGLPPLEANAWQCPSDARDLPSEKSEGK